MKLYRLTVTMPPGTAPPAEPPPMFVKTRDVPRLLPAVMLGGSITLRRVR